MDNFLKAVEKKAYRIALLGCGQPEDALDIVQESMIRLVAKYSGKPEAEWKPLFYRILNNQIKDYQRRRIVRSRLFSWLGNDDDDDDPLQNMADPAESGAEHQLQVDGAFAELETSLKQLPFRQRQVFLLRSWEELSVAETAKVMGCSEGSVKTHYSRALSRLREKLGEHWP
ncbi:RNA polymerase sigma-70 factor, ECF subfamily [Malonomonas rubra DSM 5091]|uniref:RNA polymerase sigma-70 factor, ECF subfamily n=1 Tax=Malonomonas rubra DSM 5091 TaxID=1122189 RepID=A0A1M6CJK4_MALRU|nr:RNA polymerase sigma factor [Malonomonas rubra]SHI61103.1 RNA polymerase sigma-70 factor, ECF subfamily [Malonomonas rubra DSM 5091]